MTEPNGRNTGIGFPNRHPQYYIEGADLHVLVSQNTLFRVHSYFFSRESSVFFHRRLNPASPGDVKEGLTDKDPITLMDINPDHFAKLLWVFYNPRYSIYEASVEDWTDILTLADMWGFREVKELAVRELHKKKDLDLIARMALYQKYKIDPRHLVPLYAELCARPIPLTPSESAILGLEATLLIMTNREKLRSKPSADGLSPLPDGMDDDDIFRAIESTLEIEEGATKKFQEENPTVSPTSLSSSSAGQVNGSSNRLGAGRGSGRANKPGNIRTGSGK